MSEPRGRLAQCSVSLRAVLAASLGAHRKAQHARVCFAGGRYFSRQRQLRECCCSARSAKRLAESTLGNCMLGVWLCPSRSRAPGGTRGGTGCKGAHHRSRYSPFRHWLKARAERARLGAEIAKNSCFALRLPQGRGQDRCRIVKAPRSAASRDHQGRTCWS